MSTTSDDGVLLRDNKKVTLCFLRVVVGIKQCEALLGVAETGERRPLQDKTPIYTSSQNKKYTLNPVSAFTLFTPAYPVSATPTAFAPQIGQFPLFSAGVQTMRARICSAFSCDMFARVVCLRLRRAAKLPTCVLSFVALTRHAWLARLTRARRRWFGRRTARVLLADFCRAFSHSKAR